MRSKIANTARTSTLGYLPYFPQQIAHGTTRDETGLKTFPSLLARGLCHRLKLSVSTANPVTPRLTRIDNLSSYLLLYKIGNLTMTEQLV